MLIWTAVVLLGMLVNNNWQLIAKKTLQYQIGETPGGLMLHELIRALHSKFRECDSCRHILV